VHLLVSELYRFQNARSNDKNCTTLFNSHILVIILRGQYIFSLCAAVETHVWADLSADTIHTKSEPTGSNKGC